MLPRCNRDQLLAALARFDAEQREGDDWRGWDTSQNHRWAIRHSGRTYPIKQVVALAAGVAAGTFSGGAALNARVARLGFTVELLAERSERPVSEMPDAATTLQARMAELELRLQEAETRVLTAQARFRLALAALAAIHEYADHSDGCPVAPCMCGYILADARATTVAALADE